MFGPSMCNSPLHLICYFSRSRIYSLRISIYKSHDPLWHHSQNYPKIHLHSAKYIFRFLIQYYSIRLNKFLLNLIIFLSPFLSHRTILLHIRRIRNKIFLYHAGNLQRTILNIYLRQKMKIIHILNIDCCQNFLSIYPHEKKRIFLCLFLLHFPTILHTYLHLYRSFFLCQLLYHFQIILHKLYYLHKQSYQIHDDYHLTIVLNISHCQDMYISHVHFFYHFSTSQKIPLLTHRNEVVLLHSFGHFNNFLNRDLHLPFIMFLDHVFDLFSKILGIIHLSYKHKPHSHQKSLIPSLQSIYHRLTFSKILSHFFFPFHQTLQCILKLFHQIFSSKISLISTDHLHQRCIFDKTLIISYFSYSLAQ